MNEQSTTDFQGHQSAEGVCPCCGYCRHCGRSNPYRFVPYNPWPNYPQPYIGDPVWLSPNVTCGINSQSSLDGGRLIWNSTNGGLA